MNAEIISKKLVDYRKNKGLTQLELANEINYSDKVISKWERSESIPGIEALKMLADFYGTTVDHLISEEEECFFEEDNKMLLVKEIDGPSKAFKASILLPFLFLLITTVEALWSGPSMLWPISILILVLYLIFYQITIVRTSFESEYKGHKIRVTNKISGLNVYLDDKLVDSDKSLFSLGTSLSCKIGTRIIKIKISANLFITCQMFVE